MYFLLSGLFLLIAVEEIYTSEEIEIRMPSVRGEQDDDYICIAKQVPEDSVYITEFTPLYDERITHHMILNRCNEPWKTQGSWHCGEFEGHSLPVCKDSESIIFSWAVNAPKFSLPPGVSFEVGKESQYKYLVLQVHYKDLSFFTKNEKYQDQSGVRMTVEHTPTPKLAGVYLFATDGIVKANSITKLSVTCGFNGRVPMNVIFFRVHAHSHGVVNTATRIRDGIPTLIGSASPQQKQTFYKVNNSVTIENGDLLRAKCVMYNKEDRDVPIGNTRSDEMCNVYLMYTVDALDGDVVSKMEYEGCSSGSTASSEEISPPVEYDYRELEDKAIPEIYPPQWRSHPSILQEHYE